MRLFLTECRLPPISPTDCFHGGVSRAATTTMVVSVGQPQPWWCQWGSHYNMVVSVGQPLQPWWCQWGSHYNHGGVSGSATTTMVVSVGQPQPWWCHWGSYYNHGGVNGAATITMVVSVGQPLQPWWCQWGSHYNHGGVNGAATTTMVVSVGQPPQPWWCQGGSHHNHGGVSGAATTTMVVSVERPLPCWWAELVVIFLLSDFRASMEWVHCIFLFFFRSSVFVSDHSPSFFINVSVMHYYLWFQSHASEYHTKSVSFTVLHVDTCLILVPPICADYMQIVAWRDFNAFPWLCCICMCVISVTCPPGYTSSLGSKCTACSVGSYFDSTTGSCQFCPSGTRSQKLAARNVDDCYREYKPPFSLLAFDART